jgi:hypothetical protein
MPGMLHRSLRPPSEAISMGMHLANTKYEHYRAASVPLNTTGEKAWACSIGLKNPQVPWPLAA